MALVFPANNENASFIRVGGTGRLYLGAYVSAGADASSLSLVGSTSGGVVITPKRTQYLIHDDQHLGAIGAHPMSEEWTVEATVIDTTLANVYAVLGYVVNTLTNGTRTSSDGTLPVGEEQNRVYKQLVWKGLSLPGIAGTGVWQFYRCIVEDVGSLGYVKEKEVGIKIKWRCLTDPSVVVSSTKGAVGVFFES